MPLCYPTLTIAEYTEMLLEPDYVEMMLVGCYTGNACAVCQAYSAAAHAVRDECVDGLGAVQQFSTQQECS